MASMLPRTSASQIRNEEYLENEERGVDPSSEADQTNMPSSLLAMNELAPLAELFALEVNTDDDDVRSEDEIESSAEHQEGDEEDEDGVRQTAASSSRLSFPAQRIRYLLRYEGSSSVISKDALEMVSAAVVLMVKDLTRSSAEIATRRQRRRVTSDEVGHAVSTFDRFSFLSDVIPPSSVQSPAAATTQRSGGARAGGVVPKRGPTAAARDEKGTGFQQTTLRF